MSSDQAYDPQLIEQTKRQIRTLVQEIAQFSKTDMAPDQFYAELLPRVVSALAAVGGGVWTTGDQGRLGLQYQVNLQETRLPEQGEQEQMGHGRLLHKVMTTGEAILVPPHTGGEDGEQGLNPTDYLLVLGVLRTELEVVGVMEIFQRPEPGAAIQQGYLRFVAQMCDLAGDFLKSRQLRHFSDRQALWTQLEEFSRSVHGSLNPRETAYTIANEGRRLIECDRVSVAVRRGKRCFVEAVSGQDLVDKRSNMVRLLGKLATVVVASEEPMWYTGDTRDMAPQVEDAVQEYVDETHTKMVAVLPLFRPELIEKEREKPGEVLESPSPAGALIVEQIEDSRVEPKTRQRVDVVCRHSAAALANALEHHSLFLMPLWRALGKSRVVTRARHLPKVLIVLGLLVSAVIALAVVPADFALRSKGTLEPVIKRNVWAQTDADEVSEVLVDHGKWVKDKEILVRLRNYKLQDSFQDVEGRLREATAALDATEQQLVDRGLAPERLAELRARRTQLATQVSSLKTQYRSLDTQVKALVVKSPDDGQVITWDPRNRLIGRPVQKGQMLLTIAKTKGAWEVELHMSEDRIGHIRRAQNKLLEEVDAKLKAATGAEFEKQKSELSKLPAGERIERLRQLTGQPDIDDRLEVPFILYGEPGTTHYGRIREMEYSAEPRADEGVTVLIKVDFDKDELGKELLQQGTSVTGKVGCGRRALGYVLFHDLGAWIQKTWFRWF